MTIRSRAPSVTAVQGRDWRYQVDDQESKPHQTKEELANLTCPFDLPPEQNDTIPPEFTFGAVFIRNTVDPNSIPWTGYYTLHNQARLTVANAYGVWFELLYSSEKHVAIRRARKSLQLKDWPVPSINLAQLDASGLPLVTKDVPQSDDEGKC